MRILHVVPTLSKGGGEKILVDLANKFFEEGHEIEVLQGWPSEFELQQKNLNKKIHVITVASNKLWAYIKMPFWIVCKREYLSSFDLIHNHLLWASLFGTLVYFFRMMKLISKLCIVETNHLVGMGISAIKLNILTRLIRYRDGVAFMATDKYWDELMKKFKKIKSAIIQNGIYVPETPASKEISKSILLKKIGWANTVNKPIVVGTVGMLRPDRHPVRYIELFKLLLEKLGGNVVFLIGGSGVEEAKMVKEVEKFDIKQNVFFLGLLSNPPELMKGLDIYVSVAVGAFGGVSMIEAAMVETPVFALQLNKDSQSEDTWFINDSNAEKLADKIKILYINKADCEFYQKKQFVFVNGKFSIDTMFARYEQFYKSILES